MPSYRAKGQCKFIDGLQKFVDVANQTKLNKVTKGNTTKEVEQQAKVATAQTELTVMQSSSTLVSACAALKASQEGTSTTKNAAAAASSSAAKKSAAVILKGARAGGAILPTMVVVAIGMFL